MHIQPQLHIVAMLVCLLVLAGAPHNANADAFDFLTQSVDVNPDSISITSGGVTATVQAFHVQFDGSTSTIYGPFTTGTIDGRLVFGQNSLGGLSLNSHQDLGQQDDDLAPGLIQPGFDSGASSNIGSNPPPSLQFALFSFDAPVDISQVTVDNVSNFGNRLWVAGGSSAPNLSLDLFSAFSSFTVINPTPQGVAPPVQSFSPMTGISFFAIGSPVPASVENPGPFTTGGAQFYINAIGFEPSEFTDPGSVDDLQPIPEPTSLALLGIGGAILAAKRRRQRRRLET